MCGLGRKYFDPVSGEAHLVEVGFHPQGLFRGSRRVAQRHHMNSP